MQETKRLINQIVQENMKKMYTMEKAMDIKPLNLEGDLADRLEKKLKNKYAE